MIPDVNEFLQFNDNVTPRTSRNLTKVSYEDKVDINFDFLNNDLVSRNSIVLDANGNEVKQNVDVVFVSGIQNVRAWIAKAIKTERNAFAIYSSRYGFDIYDTIGRNIPNEAFDMIFQNILEDTVLYHPNIIAIRNVQSRIHSDDIYVAFDAVLDDDVVINETFRWVVV